MDLGPADARPRALGRSQADVVVESIREMIVDGRLRPGDRLPIENDLATTLGVSRSPLRKAVRALSVMGVLETRQGAGTYVTALDFSTLLAPISFVVDLHYTSSPQHLHLVRRILETEAAALAARHIGARELAVSADLLGRNETELAREQPDHEAVIENDIAFHRIVAEASGNPVLAAFISVLGGRMMRDQRCRSSARPGADETAHHEHVSILTALSAHQPCPDPDGCAPVHRRRPPARARHGAPNTWPSSVAAPPRRAPAEL
ncbi:MAG TPA: GntR family transcriptional regulator [Kribbella sp.]|nr:GntR family transcriptional regulator [Kribbella sp.]